MSIRASCSALGVLTLVALAGCNPTPSTVPVSGTLTWEDGKPISGASVRFVPATEGQREATGFTGKDGDFSLSTFTTGDGAVRGDYTVVLTKTVETPQMAPPKGGGSPEEMAALMKAYREKAKAAPKQVVDPIPAVYQNEKSSPMKQKVDGALTNLKLTVKKG